MNGKKICFVVETPLQILESINLLLSYEKECEKVDIFVGTVFQNAYEISGRLEKTGLFTNVYIYDPSLYKEADLVKKIANMMNPLKRIQIVVKREISVLELSYDSIYFSTLLLPAEAIVYLNKNIHVFWIDDGMASYTGESPDPIKAHHKHGFLFKLAGLDARRLYPEAIYLNNTSFCLKHPFCKDIRMIPNLTEKYWEKTVRYVFDYKKSSTYLDPCAVYLTNPNDKNFNNLNKTYILKTEKAIFDACHNANINVIRRKHPREIDKSQTPSNISFLLDETYNMWELISLLELSSNHVLISWFSTAQFTPNMLHRKEPWVIFLYEIFRDGVSEESYKEMIKLTNILKMNYTNKHKIIVPNSVESLKNELSKIKLNA